MAKHKNQQSQAPASNLVSNGTVVASEPTPVTEQAPASSSEATEQAPAPEAEATVTLTYARTTPNGTVSYELAGIRGSLFITKSMFGASGAPSSITLPASIFAAPKVKVEKVVDPAEAQKKADEAKAKADKLAARLSVLRQQAEAYKALAQPTEEPVGEEKTEEVPQ